MVDSSTQTALGSRKYSFSRAKALLCPLSASICSLNTRVEIAFESLLHVILFPGHLRKRPFTKTEREKVAAAIPLGKSCPASEAWWLGQLKHSSQHCIQRGLGLPCFFFYGIRESFEILVLPSFCLSPSHMVLPLVSYFSFFDFFWGTKLAI